MNKIIKNIMKIYYYDELREMTIDELLDLLHIYNYLKKDIWELILLDDDQDNKDYYVQQNLWFYQLNITKIKQELTVRVEEQEESIF